MGHSELLVWYIGRSGKFFRNNGCRRLDGYCYERSWNGVVTKVEITKVNFSDFSCTLEGPLRFRLAIVVKGLGTIEIKSLCRCEVSWRLLVPLVRRLRGLHNLWFVDRELDSRHTLHLNVGN